MTRTLGIDAGGSSIRALVIDDATGACLSERTFPGRNLVFHDDTVDVLIDIVAGETVDRCGISLAGAGNRSAAHHAGEAITRRTGVPTVVVADYVAAHYACFGPGPGAVVIAGTGSVCYARDAAGERVLLGGLGPVLGDEGSAWWIGRQGVQAALRAAQGLGPATALVTALDASVPGGLAALTTAGTDLVVDRFRLARLAPIVDGLADRDEVARWIMTDAGRGLAALADTATRQLGPLPVGLVGGVFASSTVTSTVTAMVGETTSGHSPAEAAAHLAAFGQTAADRLGNVRAPGRDRSGVD